MTKTIVQSVKFHATPEELFELYLDAKKHSAATGAPLKISRNPLPCIPSSPADELNDFEAVARRNNRRLPGSPRQNPLISLDGHPRGIQAQMDEQRGDAQAVRNFARLAVDLNLHEWSADASAIPARRTR